MEPAHLNSRKNPLPAFIWPIAALCSMPVHAAHEAVPKIGVYMEADDNARFGPDAPGDTSASRSVVDASVELAVYNERGTFILEPQVIANFYQDDGFNDLDSNDTFLLMRGDYAWTKVSAGFRVYSSQQIVRRAEVLDLDDDLDADTPIDVGSGRVLINQDRDRIDLGPYLEFKLSDRNSLLFEVDSTNVSFSQNNVPTLTGFDYTSAKIELVRRVDTQNTVSARVFSNEYTAEFNDNVTNTVGVEGEFTRPIGQLVTLNFVMGVQRSDFAFLNNLQQVNNASTNLTYGLRFRKRAQRSSMNLDLTHTVDPSSSGFVVERNEIYLGAFRNMTERLVAGLGLATTQAEPLDNPNSTDDRDYSRAEFYINWKFKREWSLNSGYNFTTQKFVNQGGTDSTSHALFIGVQYQGLSRRRPNR